ncbi:hypothetical protein L6164_024035 [Bauhinia variegata]|uniref:Uncharacterized protein n=1 Tax=Bauhinia variegata TaxID=167791 RepID=A0ACB9LWF5_BAUVA|nr:hypothetical protein L6164_024035 [Bauhinia variegata]
MKVKQLWKKRVVHFIDEHNHLLHPPAIMQMLASQMKIEAYLCNPVNFKVALEGCIVVYHVAAPVDIQEREPAKSRKTEKHCKAVGILSSCFNSSSVKVVVCDSKTSLEFKQQNGLDVVTGSSFGSWTFHLS